MTSSQIQTILANGIENADIIAIDLINHTIRQYYKSENKLKIDFSNNMIKIESYIFASKKNIEYIDSKSIEYIDFKSIVRIKLYYNNEYGGDAE